jgi:hypothetical protein
VLELITDQASRKVVFELEYTPWLSGLDISFPSTDQYEISNNGYPNRFLNAVDIFGDLVFSQAQPALKLFEKNLKKPYRIHL